MAGNLQGDYNFYFANHTLKDFSVRIHVITYRRVHLLKRALISILNQTHTKWIAEVINDDPDDVEVEALILSFADERIMLSKPMIKRGGTGNFNYAFRHVTESFCCILEDDNWYEPSFLATMMLHLGNNPSCEMAVANEVIWKETPKNGWESTGQTIWQPDDAVVEFTYELVDKCGKAKICNSSMFWRSKNAHNWQTPREIPIDVTEHYRERIIPHPILLIHTPLVNFAATISSNRKGNENAWTVHQSLLVSSIFSLCYQHQTKNLAKQLWFEARTFHHLFSYTLLFASFVDSRSKILWELATTREKLRFIVAILKRPLQFMMILNAKKNHYESWNYLMNTSPKQEKDNA
ncbi:glycosyltransferase involved in cell wall biosynthesis [Flavobacterium sp. W4I14]|nr:glycosyltransferase involved in cell wall biosynthesis [Flavobacterium sp. W4I14]